MVIVVASLSVSLLVTPMLCAFYMHFSLPLSSPFFHYTTHSTCCIYENRLISRVIQLCRVWHHLPVPVGDSDRN